MIHEHNAFLMCCGADLNENEHAEWDNLPINQVKFDNAVTILANTPTFAGTDGRKEVVEQGVRFTFEDSPQLSYREGQIPILVMWGHACGAILGLRQK